MLLLILAAACGSENLSPTRPLPVTPVPAPSDLLGKYKLTFTAAPSCSLPPEAKQLTFEAWMFEETPGSIRVDLNTAFPCFCNPGFTGTRQGDAFRFVIVGGPPGDETVVELVGNGREVRYEGTATATQGDKNITGIFSGRISVVESASGATLATCDATDHKMDFVQ